MRFSIFDPLSSVFFFPSPFLPFSQCGVYEHVNSALLAELNKMWNNGYQGPLLPRLDHLTRACPLQGFATDRTRHH